MFPLYRKIEKQNVHLYEGTQWFHLTEPTTERPTLYEGAHSGIIQKPSANNSFPAHRQHHKWRNGAAIEPGPVLPSVRVGEKQVPVSKINQAFNKLCTTTSSVLVTSRRKNAMQGMNKKKMKSREKTRRKIYKKDERWTENAENPKETRGDDGKKGMRDQRNLYIDKAFRATFTQYATIIENSQVFRHVVTHI